MNQELWTAVDSHIAARLAPHDAALEAALKDSADAGLPAISVSAAQGKLLQILAATVSAERILEIGTLGGYSTIWMARALPAGGRLVTLEYEPKHAAVATKNIARAGLAERVEVRVGKALDLLPAVRGPFDLVFIDADKASIPDYFAWALKLTRKGALIVVDNVVRGGRIVEEKHPDPNVQGVRRFLDILKDEKRVQATAIQTVGTKGYDGFALALVVG
ncbi:MAG: O-methyltransferase [Elusimicrobia bacterium]|nr:O-methyltransferase [Elusimicrobiota bacterium]